MEDQNSRLGEGIRESAEALKASEPAKTQTFGSLIVELMMPIFLMGAWKVVVNVIHLVATAFSYVVNFILHRNFGERAISLPIIFFLALAIQIFGSFAEIFNSARQFTGLYWQYGQFLLLSKVTVILGLFHYAYMLYRRYVHPDLVVYSFYRGSSWLFQPWIQLSKRLNIRVFQSEFGFQYILEPILFALTFYVLSLIGVIAPSVSKLAIVCTFCQWYTYHMQVQNLRDEVISMRDAILVNTMLSEDYSENTDQISKQGFSVPKVLLNQLKAVHEAPKDDSIYEIQKKQTL